MITTRTVTAKPWAMPACAVSASNDHVPALLPTESGTGASFEGRLMVVGIQYIAAARVPAFLTDAFPGVPAWSPPV
jgi:hypothetical protein